MFSLGHQELFYQENPNYNIKHFLSMNQGNRCYKCQNYLVNNEETKLSYKIPLQYGGHNNKNNLVVICPTCSQLVGNII